jgi:hypothetical protein
VLRALLASEHCLLLCSLLERLLLCFQRPVVPGVLMKVLAAYCLLYSQAWLHLPWQPQLYQRHPVLLARLSEQELWPVLFL